MSCVPGKYSNAEAATTNATCTLCDRGKYSSTEGADSGNTCVECSAGKYLNAHGSNDEAACLSCVENTISETGSVSKSACQCAAGYTGTAPTCAPCQEGKFKGVKGQNPCTACDKGKYSDNAGSSVCTDCPSYTFSTIIGAVSEDVCAQCVAGKYLDPQDELCKNCRAGKYSATVGAFFSDCINCGAYNLC